MPRISMSAKLNDSSRLSVVNTSEYKEIYLDVENIIPAEENFYPLTEIEELADDILERGQLQPLLIGRVDGEYKLAAGHRRRAAILLNNERGHKSKAWCFAKEMDQIEFMLTLISANAFTRRMDDATLLEQAEKLNYWTDKAISAGKLKITGRKRDYVAERLQISPTKMAQVNQVSAHLSDEGKEALKKGEINFSKAYETSKLPEEEQSEVIQDKHLLSSDVRAMVKERKEPKISFVEDRVPEENTDIEESVSLEFQIENVQQEHEEKDEIEESEESSKKEILSQEIEKYRYYLISETDSLRKRKFKVLFDALVYYKNMLYPPTKE